jgi:hypothetical protein
MIQRALEAPHQPVGILNGRFSVRSGPRCEKACMEGGFMQAFFEIFLSPGFGSAEFFVGVLVACGFLMIGISSLMPKSGDEELEWWER